MMLKLKRWQQTGGKLKKSKHDVPGGCELVNLSANKQAMNEGQADTCGKLVCSSGVRALASVGRARLFRS
jgi:hypothetical protein